MACRYGRIKGLLGLGVSLPHRRRWSETGRLEGGVMKELKLWGIIKRMNSWVKS